MIVKVTQKHIDEGCRCSGLHCPVALALAEATNQDWWVGDDDKDGGTVLDPCIGEEFNAPAKVTRFVRRFDRYKSVKPFEFEIPDDCVYEEESQ